MLGCNGGGRLLCFRCGGTCSRVGAGSEPSRPAADILALSVSCSEYNMCRTCNAPNIDQNPVYTHSVTLLRRQGSELPSACPSKNTSQDQELRADCGCPNCRHPTSRLYVVDVGDCGLRVAHPEKLRTERFPQAEQGSFFTPPGFPKPDLQQQQQCDGSPITACTAAIIRTYDDPATLTCLPEILAEAIFTSRLSYPLRRCD